MNLVKRIISSEKIFIFLQEKKGQKVLACKAFIYIFFILLHLFLFNVNTAEWGDTYRILRASEFIREGSYPIDEKRPPLFSMVLSIRPESVNQIAWGRGVMFVVSILTLLIFDQITKIFIKDKKYQIISLLFFILNPVFLYWSLRVYADCFFTLIVLLVFYLMTRWKDSLNLQKIVVIGIFIGFSIMTRFEGYILLASVLVGILYSENEFTADPKKIVKYLKSNTRNIIILGLTTFITILSYLMMRNPLSSKYFSEPQKRIYDLRIIWTYFVSLIYIFGFVYASYFILLRFQKVFNFLKKHVNIFIFLVLELILILLWPAAIPRLFVPIIPFLIILFVLSYEDFVKSKKKLEIGNYTILGLFFGFYVSSQYFLRLQFMILQIPVFIGLIGLQVILVFFLFKRKYFIFVYLSLVSSLVWGLSTIWLHKGIYTAIKSASIYARENISGTIAFNDVTSTSDWYINYADPSPSVSGFFYSMHSDELVSYKNLLSHNITHLLVTNEDSVSVTPEIERSNYLTLIKEFRYNIGEKQFYAKVYKFSGGIR